MSDTKDAYQRFVSEWMSKHPGHAPTSRAAWDAAIAHSQAAHTQALLGWTRYEKARKLNPAQWAELHQRNLRGGNFDDMIDALPATTQPVQQDTKELPTPVLCVSSKEFKRMRAGDDSIKAWLPPTTGAEDMPLYSAEQVRQLLATPPAEKQAAPSGEDILREAENIIAALMRDTEDYGAPALISKSWAKEFMRKRAKGDAS